MESELVALAAAALTSPGVNKLIETIADQIGLFLKPMHERRKALAEKDAVVTIAQGQADVAEIQVKKALELEKLVARADEREARRQLRRQKNLEKIAVKAAHEIPASVSDKPVDQDWVSRFFEECQDVSNEEMQTIWGNILAGEVTKPGSFSFRTLLAVKLLCPEVAHLFTRLCSFVWQTREGMSPITFGRATKYFDLTFDELLLLKQNSLIEHIPKGIFNEALPAPKIPGEIVEVHYSYHSRLHILRIPNGPRDIELGKALLTDIGRELVAISGATPIEDYRKAVVEDWRSFGIEVQDDIASNPTAGQSNS